MLLHLIGNEIKRMISEGSNFLLIDEVQITIGFERAVTRVNKSLETSETRYDTL